ncbi:MAG: hypothetical protein K9G41_06660 [Flavobacteriales bacterium]|nr:hypothetical protein [Flavobacteriales bacterium]
MLRQIHFALFILLLVAGQSVAQQYDFKQFSVEEGLPRSGVYCLLEDSRGFLWVGTEGGGLSRFDGREFVTYTVSSGLPDNTIRALFEDQDSNLWIGTDGHGVCRFDGQTFHTYSTENGLSNDYVRCITQGKDGDIWVGTFGGGINRLHFGKDSDSITVFGKDGPLGSDDVRAALRSADGALWFGTDAGLCRTDGTNWKTYGTKDSLPHNRVLVLFEDQQKNLWIGTQEGLSKKVGETFVNFDDDAGLISNRVRAIAQDLKGNMWFGTQDGISRFDGKTFVSFTEKNGLSNDRIRHITADRSGNLWFGTYFGGICRFSGEQFIHFTQQDGISSNQVLSVFNQQDGSILLGTLEGVTALRPQPNGNWEIERDPVGLFFFNQAINVITTAPNGQIWIGTNAGISVQSEGLTSELETDGLPFRENVKALLIEDDGSFWVGTNQGVSRFKKTDVGFSFDQYHSNPNVNESEVSSITRDAAGRIWIGYIRSQPVIFENGGFFIPKVPPSLTDISAMVQGPHGFLWIATEGNGLFRYQVAIDQISQSDFTHFGIEQGLSSTNLRQLQFDAERNLWAGTASGIDNIRLNNRGEIKSVKHFGRVEGFIGTETNENASCLDKKGNLWFGTIHGATRYKANAEPPRLVENKLHITKVYLEFEDVDWNTSAYANGITGYFGLPNDLNLPYALNSLTIEYKAIDLRNPDQVRYQWKLEGYSDEWSMVEDKSHHSFTNLNPNTYTFLVRSVNSNGVWNETPASFTFVVIPPIWMRWWFIALGVLLLVAMVFVIINIREKRYQAERRKLQIMVDDRTKELRHEKERSDELLLNILPLETAEELKKNGYASVQQYDMVSVLFTDFVGFTNITEGISHKELVRSLDEHFRLFDGVMDKYGIEKIKTIGDAYMAAGGIPTRTITNPMAVVAAGLEMIDLLIKLNRNKELKGETAWNLRLGIHTGSVISGVVGKNKFAFDIWGDAVNTAARMESSGEVMKVNISGSTYELVKDYFECTSRGKIKAKNKGEIEMYFVERLKVEFSDNESGFIPNSAFMNILRKEDGKISSTN